MKAGYTGRILNINLTSKSISTLDTGKYEEYGGGIGMGSALFWDLCEDKTVSGFDPKNVVAIMPSPLSATPTPGVGRTEICGINVFSYPVEWFSRSNIGGFFGTMLRYAGWDGIVIQGKAAEPVWINIINENVSIEDARGMWGWLTPDTQKEIWHRVTGREGFGDWLLLDPSKTTQGPAILCIGPAGESLSRMGTVQSGIHMAAGQGGFGGVWGSKNLKAISVLGTGSIKIADPKALLQALKWLKGIVEQKPAPVEMGRQTSCSGCFQKCKSRFGSGVLSDAQCLESMYKTEVLPNGWSASDIYQIYGLNMNDLTNIPITDGVYLNQLYQAGILGPGKTIDSTPLPMKKFGSAEYAETLCKAIVKREGIGAALTEGLMRAAKQWGRLEEDLRSGLLHKAHWGYTWHWSLPYVESSYGSLVGDREITEHYFSSMRAQIYMNIVKQQLPPEKIVQVLTQAMVPYNDDPLMFDYSWQEPDGSNMQHACATGIYSKHKAKFVAWHRHYTRFWAQSVMYCDWIWPVLLEPKTPDFSGLTPQSETRFFNAVTGKNLSFKDGMEIGRKIWNLNRAIWVLQGRHRNMENFAEFMYTPAGSLEKLLPFFWPGANPPFLIYKNGKWDMAYLENMYYDKAGVEQWKTHFYNFEGWNPDSGCPTRKTLEELGLKHVAEALKSAGKLPAGK